MSVTTKTGDDGCTGLFGAERVPKDDPVIECLGALDELDAFLADALAASPSAWTAETIAAVRGELSSSVMPSVALAGEGAGAATGAFAIPVPGSGGLESRIAETEARLPPRTGFVRSWKRPAAVKLNIARAVCRRAERRAVTLGWISQGDETGGATGAGGIVEAGGAAQVYLNRLSDLLFLLANLENGV